MNSVNLEHRTVNEALVHFQADVTALWEVVENVTAESKSHCVTECEHFRRQVRPSSFLLVHLFPQFNASASPVQHQWWQDVLQRRAF